MDLSIVIVNWKSVQYLEKCIGSIRSQTSGLNYEVIVIDAASFDGCREFLASRFPHVRFIQCNENLGFAKSNNLAAKEALGNYLLFLNPDTELVSAAINLLFDAVQQLPRGGVVGCKLLNSDGTLQTSCVQAFPNIFNQLLDSEFLRGRFPNSKLWGIEPLLQGRQSIARVDAISGACMLLRKSDFESVGCFSEDYFMYSEDVDLCYKMTVAGFQNYCLTSAQIIHYGGCSSKQQDARQFANIMLRESRWRYFKKTRGVAYANLFRAVLFASAIVRLVVIRIRRLLEQVENTAPKAASKKWSAIAQWCLWRKQHFESNTIPHSKATSDAAQRAESELPHQPVSHA